MATFVTHLIPRLDHSRSIVEAVVLESVELDVERAVRSGDSVGIVPLQDVSSFTRSI
jgi:hypothetical protein